MFHALAGCDTVSAFVGHGKKTAWSVWSLNPDLTNVILKPSKAPIAIQDQWLHTIERFVILMYDKTSTTTDVNKASKKLFAKTSTVQRIPPTFAALEQHVKRATYQGGHIWGQALVPDPVLASPDSWGQIKTDGNLFEPHWTTHQEASKICYELLFCGCKKECKKNCKCKKAGLKCTALCNYEGVCSIN